MGLDQYAYAVMPHTQNTTFSFHGGDENERYTRLAYWRKHPDLQGWMEQLFAEKGGEGEFNCQPVHLTAADLDALEEAVLAHDLPTTTGFFFGESRPEDAEDTLEFIREARKAISLGMVVYYDSWW